MLAVSATESTTVQVWSIATLTRIASLPVTQHTTYPASLGGGVFDLSFSPNGRLLAVVGIDDFIRVYSVPGFSPDPVDVFEGLNSMDAVAFSPNGRLLALGNAAGDVYLFAVPPVVKNNNLGGQTELGAFAASSKTIWSVQFLSNNMLVAGGADGVARFWSVPSGKNWNDTIPVQAVATHAGLIGAMSYSVPLGLLVTASPAGSRVWQTNPAQVATSICQSLKAPVGQSLWKDYLPGIPYVAVC
jgi:WD40 repeat protein